MKKALSLILALAFALAGFASFALTADSSTTNPFNISSIKVTNAAGYSNPYAAVDNANAFNENEAAYVVLNYTMSSPDSDISYKPTSEIFKTYETTVTSSTLDLSYAPSTVRYQTKYFDGTISAVYSGTAAGFGGDAVYNGFSYDSTEAKLYVTLDASNVESAANLGVLGNSYWSTIAKGYTEQYSVGFIAITKAATAGGVTASMKVSGTKFANYTTAVPLAANQWAVAAALDLPVLVVYDSTGVAQYTIYKIGYTYRVFSGKALTVSDAKYYLFDYVQDSSIFNYIGYSATPNALTNDAVALGFTYDGKLVYLGADNSLGTADDVDLTSVVTAANTFFGFTFATSNPAVNTSFEKKTSGNPAVVSDTYSYVTAPVVTTDEEVEIAPTGDFSANIVIILASSALLAAAALAFVIKKARD